MFNQELKDAWEQSQDKPLKNMPKITTARHLQTESVVPYGVIRRQVQKRHKDDEIEEEKVLEEELDLIRRNVDTVRKRLEMVGVSKANLDRLGNMLNEKVHVPTEPPKVDFSHDDKTANQWPPAGYVLGTSERLVQSGDIRVRPDNQRSIVVAVISKTSRQSGLKELKDKISDLIYYNYIRGRAFGETSP